MSQAPSMPFFVDAYLADTGHLTTLEHGAYMLLLLAMWRRGGVVPDDDKDNARVTRLSLAKWRTVKPRLLPFLTLSDGQFTQKRLAKEWNYVAGKREKNAQNGALGGRPQSSKNNDIAKANGSVSVSNIETQTKANPVPIPDPLPKEEEPSSLRSDESLAAEVVDAEFVESKPNEPEQFEIPEFLRRAAPTADVVPLFQPPDADAPPDDIRGLDSVEQARAAYNRVALKVGWPPARPSMSDARKRAVRTRLGEGADGFREWCEMLARAASSAFLRGQNNRGWKPGGIDWFAKLENFNKIMEGAYDNPANGQQTSSRGAAMDEGFARAAARHAD